MTRTVRDPAVLGRRLLLIGAGGALLAGCGGGGGAETKKATASEGPIIRNQDAGTVISSKDLKAFAGTLNEAVRNGDVSAMRAVIPDLDVAEWTSRLRSMQNFPLTDLGFVFEDTLDRKANAAGGALEVNAQVVLTHRIKDCDARVVVQPYSANLAKSGPDADITVSYFSGPNDDDAPWDLPGTWKVVETDHCVISTRDKHLGDVMRYRDRIDAGAAAAMKVVPPDSGITKLSFTIAEAGSPVFGGSKRFADRDGLAFRMTYIDPETAAGKGASSGDVKGDYATSRIVLHPSLFTRGAAEIESTAKHESAHGLALKWGFGAAAWIAEGFAIWVEAGGADGFRRDGYRVGLVKSGYGAFSGRFQGFDASYDNPRFQGGSATEVNTNYNCSGAIFCAMEAANGRKGVLKLARLLYEKDVEQGPKDAGFKNQQDLFDFGQQWVNSL